MRTADPQLWLIEGLPGSGKTSAAERLNALCAMDGLSSRWWLEESKDHPVLPAVLRKKAKEPGFSDLCVQAFRDFIRTETGVLILEGSAFQNSIRFMFANARSEAEISDYLAAWADAVCAVRPRLLMFEVRAPEDHYANFLAARRGAAWMEKLIAYVESTPVAEQCGWRGFDGFVQFWADYQQLCLACAKALPWPVKFLPAWPEVGAFDDETAYRFFRR
jgi:hypothetical protein